MVFWVTFYVVLNLHFLKWTSIYSCSLPTKFCSAWTNRPCLSAPLGALSCFLSIDWLISDWTKSTAFCIVVSVLENELRDLCTVLQRFSHVCFCCCCLLVFQDIARSLRCPGSSQNLQSSFFVSEGAENTGIYHHIPLKV